MRVDVGQEDWAACDVFVQAGRSTHHVLGAQLGLVGAVGIVGIVGIVGDTCGENQRDAVPGSIHKLWVALGYRLLRDELKNLFHFRFKFSAKYI